MLFLFLVNIQKANAQDKENEIHGPSLRGALVMANSPISQAVDGVKKLSIIPKGRFDVAYHFHKRGSAALLSDIKVQNF